MVIARERDVSAKLFGAASPPLVSDASADGTVALT